MREIPLTYGLCALVDDEDFERLSGRSWFATNRDARRAYGGCGVIIDGRRTTAYMHRLILQAPMGIVVDHRDKNGLNNQRVNLRVATQVQNLGNARLFSTNTSGWRGVRRDTRNGKWYAQIMRNGHNCRLGTYENLMDARQAYAAAARQHFGEFYQEEA